MWGKEYSTGKGVGRGRGRRVWRKAGNGEEKRKKVKGERGGPEVTQEKLKGFGRSYRMKWHRRVGGQEKEV